MTGSGEHPEGVGEGGLASHLAWPQPNQIRQNDTDPARVRQLCLTSKHLCMSIINKLLQNSIKAFEYPCTILCRGREQQKYR
jgi:hypothetical protein